MASWSSRRKLLYGGSLIIIILTVLIAIVFSYFYKAPTCADGKRNGNETGVDCGGSCLKLCQSAFLPAKIKWGGAKYEKISDNLYNVASYIVNPNTNGAAVNVPYKFSLFDAQGLPITERVGRVTLPPHRNTLAFESAVNVGKNAPVKVTFEFLKEPEWFKSHDTLDGIAIIDKNYTEDDKNSSLAVTLENRSLLPYRNIEVSAILYDKEDNAIGFSRTEIDVIGPKGGREIAPFTWPKGRHGDVTSIEVLPAIEPARDI